MFVSEAIEELQRMLVLHGDIPVVNEENHPVSVEFNEDIPGKPAVVIS